MPTYTIFAGVNGCGKTSIYKSVYYEENKNEKRINTDEMVARIGSCKDNTYIFKERIYFKNGILVWNDKLIPNWANKLVK